MRARNVTVLLVALGAFAGLASYTLWYAGAAAYLSDTPAACVNCHVMRDNFTSWGASSHRSATCNDCHLSHGFLEKYLAKAENGLRHSAAFTFENVQVPRAKAESVRTINENCVRCHNSSVSLLLGTEQDAEVACTRCHKGTGHIL